jgi:predicted transcriptional regulator of viral defense system
MKLSDYIHKLASQGKCYFTTESANEFLKTGKTAVKSSITRMLFNKQLASPAKGFYIIVPPEYQILGCLPADQFIPYLMEYWQSKYYAGLLTAAMYHGASHQQPQTFQVVVEKNRRPIQCGRIKINFIAKKNLIATPTQTISTIKSILIISSPEATAMDLVLYPHQSGELNHIATVLTELAEKMDAEKLFELAEQNQEISWKQRLGYLLEILGYQDLANALKKHLQNKRVDYILLAHELKLNSKLKRSFDWKIIINTTIESDI